MRAPTVLGYVAQLVPPPDNIVLIELAGAMKAMSMATSALDTTCAYSLERIGGIKLLRPSTYMMANLIRMAVKTLPIGQRLFDELKNEVKFSNHSACRTIMMEATESYSPHGWDTPPICQTTQSWL